MSSTSAAQTKSGARVGPARVVNCYTFFDHVFVGSGLVDYTEGMYHGDPKTPYDQAQLNQIHYVLDEVGCDKGVRLLEVGCGNGRLLVEAAKRGASIVGITISPEQVEYCRSQGVDARLVNYRDLGDEWQGQFDSVIANGPMEHFVQPAEAAAGRADSIYREFFEICHRAIDPASPLRRFINTTINFVRTPKPEDLYKPPSTFPRGSDEFHYSMLEHTFGGWYPELGQLERCAAGRFEVTKCIDGTEDYHFTSEDWLRFMQAYIRNPKKVPGMAWRLLPFLLRHPKQCITMLRCGFTTQSWNWQFRGPNPPTRLLRQTWRYVPESSASEGSVASAIPMPAAS